MKYKKNLVAMFMLFILLLTACVETDNGNASNEPIVVSGKNWTEQYILSQILAVYIEENTDYTVDLQDGLGEVAILTPALEKGDIDMYVEYSELVWKPF